MEDPVNIYMNLDHWNESGLIEEEEEEVNEAINQNSTSLVPPSSSPSLPSSSSSSSSASSSSEIVLVGCFAVKVVGLHIYSGTISGREMVAFARDPHNIYDSNAIKVFNMQAVHVGYVERRSSTLLAPLMDACIISMEGIILHSISTNGGKNRFKLPCQVHIFTRMDKFPMVRTTIVQGGLPVIIQPDARSCGFNSLETAIEKEKAVQDEIQSIDSIFKLVGEKDGKKKGLMEAPKEFIKSELFLHQKEGLGWLYHRENSQALPPFWEEKDGTFVNILTNYQTDKRPEPLRGGIFADDMGLGKTLTLLSLIASNRPSTDVDANHSHEELERRNLSGPCKKIKLNDDDDKINNKELVISKATLIVCPLSVFSSWVAQLSEHTREDSFKVYMYYGERTRDPKELQGYDIVLTTYTTLAAELNVECSPMKKIEWFRVILDEAHFIKNAEARQSKAVINLKAKRRWAVTGTPIQNGSFDLFALMAFLNFEPFSVKSYWQRLVQRPLNQGFESGLSRLQVLMETISLRRIKENSLVELPPKTLEICYVELFSNEREKYDQMEVEAKAVLQNYIRIGSVIHNYSAILSIILRLRQICDDMTLCPSDMRPMLNSNNIEDVSNKPELLKKMLLLLQDGEDFDCPICISPPTDIIITCCAHIFCKTCILKALKRPKPNCPLCRHSLSESDLFSASNELCLDHTQNIQSSNNKKITSSKVSTLLKLLNKSRVENPSVKSVVFSQFKKMLLILEEPLKEAGFGVFRLDGSMTLKKRTEVIKEFKNKSDNSPTVMLASLKASGAGINLSAASRVYLFEPWWNPAIEEQAMDRVHRIGQTENVKIVRLIVKNSIEERILELQERKKKLARDAFGRKGGNKERAQVGMEELRMLISL